MRGIQASHSTCGRWIGHAVSMARGVPEGGARSNAASHGRDAGPTRGPGGRQIDGGSSRPISGGMSPRVSLTLRFFGVSIMTQGARADRGRLGYDNNDDDRRSGRPGSLRKEGIAGVRCRLCDGRIRPIDPGFHALGDRRGASSHADAGGLARDLDANRRGCRWRAFRHAKRLSGPGARAHLDDPVVRRVHRPVRPCPRLLGFARLPDHRRPWARRSTWRWPCARSRRP